MMMPPPFNRWDSTRYACSLAVIFAGLASDAAWQWGGWQQRGLGLTVMAAGGAAFVLSGLLSRRLPPDIPLRPLDAVERRHASAPPQAELARLRVAFAHESLGFSRMDIYLDGVRVGQLRAGMAFVMPMRPGLRVLSARVWLRRLDLRDQINALPGTDADITIRVSGSKYRSYDVERHGLQALLHDERTILVRPGVAEA